MDNEVSDTCSYPYFEASLMCIEYCTLFPLPLSRVNRLLISVTESGVALTTSFGNRLISFVVALYRFIRTQGIESSAVFTHYYTWSRIWIWAAGPSFWTIGTVASPGVTSLVSWRSMDCPSFSTSVWCPILITIRWTSFTWVTRLPDTLHKMKFEVLKLGCDAYRIRKLLPSVPVLSQIYPVRSSSSCFLFGLAVKVKQSRYRPGVAQSVPGI